MQRVSDVVSEYVPNTWDQVSPLVNETYRLVLLASSSPEYNNVTRPIVEDGYRVSQVRRLQNRYMFGRYMLRKQQLHALCEFTNVESIQYFCIKNNKESVKNLCTYNLDYRRLQLARDAFNMYTTPKTAVCNSNGITPTLLIVARVSRKGHQTTMDSEIYPEYLILSDCLQESVPNTESEIP